MTRQRAYRAAILISAPGRVWYAAGWWDRLAMAFLTRLGF